MRVHHAQTLTLSESVVTVGAFDGVHRGHQALLRKVVERATELDAPSVAYTFDPPPRAYFEDVPMLTSLDKKIQRLESLRLDHAVVTFFDAAYAARSPQDFLEELADLNPVEVWVGPDFRFGHAGEGNVDTLSTRFMVRVFQPLRCREGKVISSSRVRTLLERGRQSKVRDLLNWQVQGEL